MESLAERGFSRVDDLEAAKNIGKYQYLTVCTPTEHTFARDGNGRVWVKPGNIKLGRPYLPAFVA